MSATRHAWVDYNKGICILGVVTLYAAQKMSEELGVEGWMRWWVDFARPFRMPDFFLLSGLFLARTIERPLRSFLDTKVVHYLYFYGLWTLLYFTSKLVIGRAGTTPAEHLADLGFMLFNGFAMLWFIAMLPIFFVVARLTRSIPWWAVLPVAALLQLFPLHTEAWLLVGHFCERFVYFYIGYRFADRFFDLAAWAGRSPRLALGAVLAWALANEWLVLAGLADARGWSLGAGLAGCCAIIVVGVLLSRVAAMDWLRYLGQHSIVTYLSFFLPMGALIVSMQGTGPWFDPGTTAALVSVMSVMFGLALFWGTRATGVRFLFERPAWARLDPSSRRAGQVVSQPVSNPDSV